MDTFLIAFILILWILITVFMIAFVNAKDGFSSIGNTRMGQGTALVLFWPILLLGLIIRYIIIKIKWLLKNGSKYSRQVMIESYKLIEEIFITKDEEF